MALTRNGRVKEDKRKFRDLKPSDVDAARKNGFSNIRIVLDPVSVLSNSKLAYEREWTNWIKACAYAEKANRESRPVPVDNEPWDFNSISWQIDRWPPSKHLYYDRFRGHDLIIQGEHNATYNFFIPDEDSMDKRGLANRSITTCDEVRRRPIGRDGLTG
jgi:hypothetical protein